MTTTVVARFQSVGEAEIARSALDAAGIDVALDDENFIAVDWLAANAVGGVKLVVREEDRDRAATVLASPAADAAALDAEPEEMVVRATAPVEQTRCPSCGGADFQPIPRLRIFGLVCIALAAVGYIFGQFEMVLAAIAAAAIIALIAPSHRCAACGERLNARVEEPEEPEPPLIPPDRSDTVEEHCPRCGSAEFYKINYRRLKAFPLLIHAAILFAAPMLLFLPKRQCDSCGFKA